MPTEREKRLEEILSNFLTPLRNIPFEAPMRGLFDRRVEPFDENRWEIPNCRIFSKPPCVRFVFMFRPSR